MSTFGGVVLEFPDIRVDYFRRIPGRRPPLACFLSHIHSDHLTGLDTLKSPFVYCSLATKELLLRLERYPHRLNFALGKLESRKLQYNHLKTLLKPVPLETPTRIELEPGNDIQVTLFDANHCIGAVMFLIEGNGKAVLYTGDIRSEPWFVSNLTRSPFLIEYTAGLKQLDCIYLDTSHTQPVDFPTKADGLKELLQKVSQYPPDTIFHFSAWTFGYEEVWMALSRKLRSPIHVDNYKWKLYQSLRRDYSDKGNSPESFHVSEGPVLAGYQCGNTPQLGCLTRDTNVRIHSCEKGMRCDAITDNTVWIRPIVTRTKLGVEIAEVGVGGGGGDLTQRPELEFDSDSVISQLLDSIANTENDVLSDIKQMLLKGLRPNQKYISLDDMGLDRDQDDLCLSDLGTLLVHAVSEKRSKIITEGLEVPVNGKSLPKVITFPYARHSSYSELCNLVKVFNPKDIYPCTVDEYNWHEGASVRHLFGQHCSSTTFHHDEEMRELQSSRLSQALKKQSQATDCSPPPPASPIQPASSSRAETTIIVRRTSPPLMPGGHAATPPQEILAVSPGSESQSLRRKAVLEGLVEGRVKRVRLRFDCDESSPGTTSQLPQEELISSPIESHENIQSNFTHNLTAAGYDLTPLNDSPMGHAGLQGEENPDAYWDPTDEVYRCGSCGHELWISTGQCSECSAVEEPAYFEVIDADLGPRPGIVYVEDDTNNHMGVEETIELVGDCLDFDSSAYDSQDERDEHNDIYEMDSFIDDESVRDSQDEGEDPSSDEETDYKQKFYELQTDYFELIDEYGDTVEEYESFKRDIMGSDYEGLYSTDEFELNEESIVVVDVAPPDPVLAEVILSQSEQQSQSQEPETPDSFVDGLVPASTEGQSQKSEAVAEEENARAEAYEIALDGRWHDVSLVSTGGNHSVEEVEL